MENAKTSRTVNAGAAANQVRSVSRTDRLPIWSLLALSMAGFMAIMTETMPAGLLLQIGRGLGISEALAGQFVTLFAVGSVAAAIPLMTATRSWSRKRVLLLALGSLFVFNAVTAVSAHYAVTLIARFAAGMATGLIWGLLAGYARRMVPPSRQGRALAIVGVGQPVALSLGVPIGTWLGTMWDWQVIFGILSALTFALIVWVWSAVPDYPGQAAHQRQPIRHIFMMPGVRLVLFVLFVWILAHNVLYTYIAPFLTHAGLAGRLDLALLIFGISSLAGIWLTGMLVDGRLRTLTLLSLAGFAVASLLLGFAGAQPLWIYIGVSAWGLTFGGGPTLLQTAIADAAGEGADMAQSMLVTVFNVAVAGGGVIGGLLLERAGPGSFPWVLVALSLAGLLAVWRSKTRVFQDRSA
ncbi:MFS transporter [Cohnella zeiphila]|uniref:MFS transporter n=1 Tax=Cohnella zeiphila TaxID=2761120 RepID=A0A7X0VXU5_9BACL|nr:MFS transporter [Cohnella zeiphila]MBB6733990.1 MFS transporter [Cohnella zeiphila]